MTKVSELSKNKEAMKPGAGASLDKDLLNKTLGKSGKPSAIKLKIKFGGKSESRTKRKTNRGPASHTDV